MMRSTLLAIALFMAGCESLPVASSTTEMSSASFPTNIGFLGATSTAEAPFLAQTDDIAAKTGIPTKAYTLPQPWESAQAYDHTDADESIYHFMGTLSPYYVSDGWGVYDYGLPDQCKIKQVHMYSRHGSRYPDSPSDFAEVIAEAGNFTASGNLSFLNDWKYDLGLSVLTNLGNQQLFDKGVRSFFRYGGLYDFESKEKIVARTTSEERMTMTALYFLNGFFGLNWDEYVDLEIQIEEDGFNSTLVPWNACPNNNAAYGMGEILTDPMIEQYLAGAVKRLNAQLDGNLTLTTTDLYNMQTLCAYETNVLGYSKFCSLFSQEEWEWYGYTQDIEGYYGDSFGNPTGRSTGVGLVVELWQRLTNTTYSPSLQTTQNSTLDSDPAYFPLDQTLYLDFTHDTTIQNTLTAMGLTQFRTNFTLGGPGNDTDDYKVSQITPFAAQFFLEVIECDEAVPANRSTMAVAGSNKTSYVHAVLNDHSLSLSRNIPDLCESRVDGWCELGSFVEHLGAMQEYSQFEESCYGDLNYTQFVYDGVPMN